MSQGKLYGSDGELVAEVDYKYFNGISQNWWGELTLTEYKKIKEGNGYVIELADGKRGRCSLRKKVNRAVYGLSPLFCYVFTGIGDLE
ncbi:MAG: hypothetical protein WC958_01080 [Dehalococcoidales bacterium]